MHSLKKHREVTSSPLGVYQLAKHPPQKLEQQVTLGYAGHVLSGLHGSIKQLIGPGAAQSTTGQLKEAGSSTASVSCSPRQRIAEEEKQ